MFFKNYGKIEEIIGFFYKFKRRKQHVNHENIKTILKCVITFVEWTEFETEIFCDNMNNWLLCTEQNDSKSGQTAIVQAGYPIDTKTYV